MDDLSKRIGVQHGHGVKKGILSVHQGVEIPSPKIDYFRDPVIREQSNFQAFQFVPLQLFQASEVAKCANACLFSACLVALDLKVGFPYQLKRSLARSTISWLENGKACECRTAPSGEPAIRRFFLRRFVGLKP